MSGHQEFKALSAEEAEQAAMRVAEMEKWAREAYLATKHVEDIEDIWVRYFEAEHHLHFIIPPATEPEDSVARRPPRLRRCGRRSSCRCCASSRPRARGPAGRPPGSGARPHWRPGDHVGRRP